MTGGVLANATAGIKLLYVNVSNRHIPHPEHTQWCKSIKETILVKHRLKLCYPACLFVVRMPQNN